MVLTPNAFPEAEDPHSVSLWVGISSIPVRAQIEHNQAPPSRLHHPGHPIPGPVILIPPLHRMGPSASQSNPPPPVYGPPPPVAVAPASLPSDVAPFRSFHPPPRSGSHHLVCGPQPLVPGSRPTAPAAHPKPSHRGESWLRSQGFLKAASRFINADSRSTQAANPPPLK